MVVTHRVICSPPAIISITVPVLGTFHTREGQAVDTDIYLVFCYDLGTT